MVVSKPLFMLNNPQENSDVITNLTDLEKEVTIPYVLENKILMAPGVHNEYYYSPEAIRRAFQNSDWNDKDVIALYLDHKDKEASQWIGFVRKPYLDGSTVRGNLEIIDKGTAIKLHAGAKMGISPKVKGDGIDGEMTKFIFQNFSVVPNPAVKAAYINMQQKEDIMEFETKSELLEEAEELKKEKEPKKEKEEMKKKKPYPEEEQMTEKDYQEILENSDYTDFVKSFLKKNPGKSVADAAKAWKEKSKMSQEMEEMNEDELLEKLSDIMRVLKKKKYPYPEEEGMKKKKYPYPEEEKMAKELNEVQEKLSQMEKKLNEPERIAVKTEGTIMPEVPSIINLSARPADEEMMVYLQKNIGRNLR